MQEEERERRESRSSTDAMPIANSTTGNVQTGFKLVGFTNFVRTNPKSDRFQVNRFHHIEFWCTDATNSSRRFSWGLGMPIVAKSDLSTGNQIHASYLLRSGDLSFLFSAATGGASTASLPTFDAATCLAFAAKHGFGVRAIALEVADAEAAFNASVANGAEPASPPALLDGRTGFAEVRLYGDVVLRYVSHKDAAPRADPSRWFLPGFEAASSSFPELDYGIRRLDHAVGNVPELAPAVRYLKGFSGFHEFAEFTAEDVGTSESGLNSVFLANNSETVLLALNEPVYGTKRKSQIETYLEHNEGAGVQHLALVTDDIFTTLREMRKRSFLGGFEFTPSPTPTYYANLHKRAGDVLTTEMIRALCFRGLGAWWRMRKGRRTRRVHVGVLGKAIFPNLKNMRRLWKLKELCDLSSLLKKVPLPGIEPGSPG